MNTTLFARVTSSTEFLLLLLVVLARSYLYNSTRRSVALTLEEWEREQTSKTKTFQNYRLWQLPPYTDSPPASPPTSPPWLPICLNWKSTASTWRRPSRRRPFFLEVFWRRKNLSTPGMSWCTSARLGHGREAILRRRRITFRRASRWAEVGGGGCFHFCYLKVPRAVVWHETFLLSTHSILWRATFRARPECPR